MLREKYSDDWQRFLTDFLVYLSETSEESWCVDRVRTKDAKANCLFGHLSNFCGHAQHENLMPDFDWFETNISTTFVVYPINDGTSENYKQATPKIRCIAYLRALLSGDELTTIPGQEKCYEDWLARQKLMKLKKCKCGGDALIFKKKLSGLRTEGGFLLSKTPEWEGVTSFFWAECLKCQSKSGYRCDYCEAVEIWNNQQGE